MRHRVTDHDAPPVATSLFILAKIVHNYHNSPISAIISEIIFWQLQSITTQLAQMIGRLTAIEQSLPPRQQMMAFLSGSAAPHFYPNRVSDSPIHTGKPA